ncbi:spore germination protein GerKC [Bacillaceae bacterium]
MKQTSISRMIALAILLFALLTILTACWNRRELNDLAIAAAIGIDKSENGRYLVSVQIINPGEIATVGDGVGGGGKDTTVSTFSARGETIFQALRKLTLEIPRKVYLSHLRVVVLSEELARTEGIGEVIDFLSRDHEVRTDFFIIVAKGANAREVLAIITPLEKIPAQKMFSSLETSERNYAMASSVTLDQLIRDLVSKGKHPVLTGIHIKGNRESGKTLENLESSHPAGSVVYSGMAAFRKDRLIGWLNEDESKGYNYIRGNVESTVVFIPCPGKKQGNISVEIIRTDAKINGKIKQGKPQAEVEIFLEGNVGEVGCDIKLTQPKTIYELEVMMERKIKTFMEKAVKKAQNDFKTDIFGFGEAIHREYPQEWKRMEQNWDEMFVKLPVDMRVDVKIRRTGTIGESFLNPLQ